MSPKPKKLLSCFFLDDVLCSFRTSEKFGMMDRCEKCEHYLRFMHEMAEEDERENFEVEEIHRLHARFERGELTKEEFRRRYFACMHGESG